MTYHHPTRIIYLTAGAGGMYCGSCMHDNQLAQAMLSLGTEVTLLPLYMPIRTDRPAVTTKQVFFGGINVYLQQKSRFWRHMPNAVSRILDHPRLLRWAGRRQHTPKPQDLGQLAWSMIKGEQGYQRSEVQRLIAWLRHQGRPDLFLLTNVLIAGCAPALKRELGRPLIVILQGDDIFLESLPEPYRTRVLDQIRQLVSEIDGFLVHSQYYAEFMAEYLHIPRSKIACIPLGIDLEGFAPTGKAERAADVMDKNNQTVLTIGYLARIAPEKGLHLLVDALVRLGPSIGAAPLQLLVAGWLGPPNQAYAEQQFDTLRRAGWGDSFTYLGTVGRAEKLRMLQQLDVLSVPTCYREPKGLYALEAMAASVPVILPDHGAFPELIEQTGGGVLFPAGDAGALADTIKLVLTDDARRLECARAGRRAVHQTRNIQTVADTTLATLGRWLKTS